MSQNKNINNQVSSPKVRKSGFDLSNTHVTSLNFGELIPVYVEPTLPGSHWKMNSEWLLKTAAMLSPAYTAVKCMLTLSMCHIVFCGLAGLTLLLKQK